MSLTLSLHRTKKTQAIENSKRSIALMGFRLGCLFACKCGLLVWEKPMFSDAASGHQLNPSESRLTIEGVEPSHGSQHEGRNRFGFDRESKG